MAADHKQVPEEVLGAYGVSPPASVTALGDGNINDTFLVESNGCRFVLQRINAAVFPEPRRLADNFVLLSEHLQQKVEEERVIFRVAQPVPTLSEEACYMDRAGDWWRGQSYVEHLESNSITITAETAADLGKTLAVFHRLTADIVPSSLAEPLPDFHRTPLYLDHFDKACQSLQRIDDEPLLWRAIGWVSELRSVAGLLEGAYQKGLVGRRVIHGDPKLDNVIFSENGVACGFFDLDTAGPGLIHYDLGDCLRSACNFQAENGADAEQVRFVVEIAGPLVESYCREAGPRFTAFERSLIYEAVLVISFELGVRFLTDHLQGDGYFRVRYRGENLLRALGQLQLARDLRDREEEIRQALADA